MTCLGTWSWGEQSQLGVPLATTCLLINHLMIWIRCSYHRPSTVQASLPFILQTPQRRNQNSVGDACCVWWLLLQLTSCLHMRIILAVCRFSCAVSFTSFTIYRGKPKLGRHHCSSLPSLSSIQRKKKLLSLSFHSNHGLPP